jgi:hypothetical protein
MSTSKEHPPKKGGFFTNFLLFLAWSGFMFAAGHMWGEDVSQKLMELLGRNDVENTSLDRAAAPSAPPETSEQASAPRFENRLASFPSLKPAFVASIPASLGDRVCEDTWCSTSANADSDAFVGWEELCASQIHLLKSVNGCPVTATFKPDDEDQTYQADLFLRMGKAPIAQWIGLAPKEHASGTFTIDKP